MMIDLIKELRENADLAHAVTGCSLRNHLCTKAADEIEKLREHKTHSMDKGPWQLSSTDGRSIESDDFTHDVSLEVHGDFESEEQRRAYAQGLADILNKHNEG